MIERANNKQTKHTHTVSRVLKNVLEMGAKIKKILPTNSSPYLK